MENKVLDQWPRSERYVVVAQRDTKRIFDGCGPIVLEQYLSQCGFLKALERARTMKANGLGEIMICRLEPIGDPEKFAEYCVSKHY